MTIDVNEVRALAAQGLYGSEIAGKMGCSPSCIGFASRRYKINVLTVTEAKVSRMTKLANAGKSTAEISRHLGITTVGVWLFAKKHEIEIQPAKFGQKKAAKIKAKVPEKVMLSVSSGAVERFLNAKSSQPAARH